MFSLAVIAAITVGVDKDAIGTTGRLKPSTDRLAAHRA
jgi:hypothetical protein